MKILVALGGSKSVWDDFAYASYLLNNRSFDVGAANDVGGKYQGKLTLWCSLHPEKVGPWQNQRRRRGQNEDYIFITHKGGVGNNFGNARIDKIITDRFKGSSGLFLAQNGVQLGYSHIICCGMPMSSSGAHYFNSEPWAEADQYRRGWLVACKDQEMRTKIRSMSGWSASVFGRPNKTWLQ